MYGSGGIGRLCTYHYAVTGHQNEPCITMGGNESHFNVSLIVRDRVTIRHCSKITTSEEKGEPKRVRTEVPLLTSLTRYRWAKPADSDLQSSSLSSVALRPQRPYGLLGTGSPGCPHSSGAV